jgi:hypothetical protein
MQIAFRYAMSLALVIAPLTSGCSESATIAAQAKGAEAVAAGKAASEPRYGTRYSDGRVSEVRVLDYFDFYRDKSVAPDPRKMQLILVAVEWGQYDAILGDGSAAFAQQPSNTMVGGDMETNQRISAPARAFFANARAAFVERRDSLTAIARVVPNRDVDRVSFDFVTNQGTFTVQEELGALQRGTSPWTTLYNEARALRTSVVRAADRKPI